MRPLAGPPPLAVAAVLLAGLLPAALPLACASKGSPEARVRAFVAGAETAAEARDLAAIKDMVAEGYRDDAGRNRRGLMAILGVHFMSNESIHLLTRVAQVRFPEEGGAEATVFVAMAGTPIPGAEELRRIRADLYRFDVLLEEAAGGRWRLASAQWRRASPADFL